MSQRVFDPRGIVEVTSKSLAPRVKDLQELRLAVVDNTKWNGAKLLHFIVDLLSKDIQFSKVNYYKKETFTKPAAPDLLRDIAANNDVALIAIAD